MNEPNSGDGYSLPSFTVLNKDDFVIVQEGDDTPINPNTLLTPPNVREDLNILHELNAMSSEDVRFHADNPEPVSETETVGSVSDREEGPPPVKKSKRLRKPKKTPDM